MPLGASLAAAVSACAVAPAPAPQPHLSPPLIRPPAEATHNLVVANADAARILAGLRARGVALAPSDVSRVDLLAGSPGYAWRVGHNWLHLHVYRDRAATARAVARFVAIHNARREIMDWAGPPHLFQCGTAVALYLGSTPQELNVLTALCGPPADAPVAYAPPV